MLNNFINRHDIISLFKKASKLDLKSFHKLIPKDKTHTVKSRWTADIKQYSTWTDIPKVAEKIALINVDCSKVNYYEYVAAKYLNLFPLTGVSLGCGMGDRELLWYKQCRWNSLVGYDLSESRIESAKARAQKLGYNQLDFQVRDINKEQLTRNSYDVIFGEDSLHHFNHIDRLFASVSKSLKPSGFFIVNDFVGPSKFQWTDRQLEVVNGLLAILPEHYRRCLIGAHIKKYVYRPSIFRMRLTDPSEAVESSDIMPALYRYFNVVEMHKKGGTLLMLLLNDIAHNFTVQDEVACRLLEIIFSIEDLLIEIGDINSDFIFAVCQKKTL